MDIPTIENQDGLLAMVVSATGIVPSTTYLALHIHLPLVAVIDIDKNWAREDGPCINILL